MSKKLGLNIAYGRYGIPFKSIWYIFFLLSAFFGAKQVFRHILPLYPYIRKKSRKCDRFFKIFKKILKNFFRSKIMRLIMPYELSVKICSFCQRGAFIAEDLLYEYDPSLNVSKSRKLFFAFFT